MTKGADGVRGGEIVAGVEDGQRPADAGGSGEGGPVVYWGVFEAVIVRVGGE
jgi:hypothetical protein